MATDARVRLDANVGRTAAISEAYLPGFAPLNRYLI